MYTPRWLTYISYMTYYVEYLCTQLKSQAYHSFLNLM